MRKNPECFEVYKHFKGAYYRIIGIGHHSETNEKLVVYEKVNPYALFANKWADREPYEWCIRPLEMFMSEVDHQKYPEVKQKYRFELYDISNIVTAIENKSWRQQ